METRNGRVNGFLGGRFPKRHLVLLNPRMGLHRDIQEHARARITRWLWGITRGGGCRSKTIRGTPWLGWPTRKGSESCGADGSTCTRSPSASMPAAITWWNEGSMWALAAYVPQAFARATEQHRQVLRAAGFLLPEIRASPGIKPGDIRQMSSCTHRTEHWATSFKLLCF